MNNWKQQIEAQIAGYDKLLFSIRKTTNWGKEYGTFAPLEKQVSELKATTQALLDVAAAADDYMTYGPLHAEFGGDIAHNRLSHALDKLREVSDE